MVKNTIAFFYPDYNPISGGSSVHGFYLAKELSLLGYTLHVFNKHADTFTQNHKRDVFSIIRVILKSDIVYVRVSILGVSRYIPYIAKMLGKNCIVELNGPPDELIATKNYTLKQIEHIDKQLRKVVRKSDAVITVTDVLKQYCENTLKGKNVYVVENGGERFVDEETRVDHVFKNRIVTIKNKHSKICVWSGTTYPWQGFNKIHDLVKQADASIAFIIISDDNVIWNDMKTFTNVFLFKKLAREEVAFIITQADIGLAVYGDFSWSRFKEFHGSSLKFYEYVANGLYTIASPTGHLKNINNAKTLVTDSIDDMCNWINEIQVVKETEIYRSWKNVAEETSLIIQRHSN